MRKLILMHGAVGSGKSYLAKQLLLDTDLIENKAVILSTDAVFTSSNYYLWDSSVLKYAHLINQTKCRVAMQRDFNLIIIDNTNITFKECEPYVKLGKEFKYDIEVKEPLNDWKFDVDECYKRSVGIHNVGRDVIQRMLDRWESIESIREKIRNYV